MLLAPLVIAAIALQPGPSLDPSVAHLVPASVSPPRIEGAGDCINPADRAAGLAAIAAWRAAHPSGYQSRSFPLTPFVPIGATLFADLLPPGYVDHDPTAGFQDYSCHNFTYDGHQGTDFGLRSFAEQDIGVPDFAVLPGVVTYYHDGEPDHSTCLCGTLANSIIVDHGNGLYGWYWHMATGTVVPHLGDSVEQGQQIGLAASSGNSAGPHIHFQLTDATGNTVYDPFAGPCGSAQSLWVNQPPLNLNTYIADFGYSTDNLSGIRGYPSRYPNTGQMGFDQFLWFWMQIVNLPANATWRQRYYRPDGSLAFDSGAIAFGNSELYRNSQYWFYTYYINDMRTIAGTWSIRFDINGVEAITAPIQVRPQATPGFNRPPAAVTVSFDPPSPTPGAALFARVNAPLALDDPDYDLVRYQYTWLINGQQVRSNTFAGRADALPASLVTPGTFIECRVTPSDGRAAAPTAIASVSLPGQCDPDVNQDGVADQGDVDYLINVVAGGSNPSGIDPDFNQDGVADQGDIDALINVIAGGQCP
ncbi:MAG: peptidoglycan DD-metalloendopeptidase family protein [Tepidisphaera sp.]|nr:peptidoglycan DD-metalloendopeptidase family protein [Tepidisphaera sp.]